MTEIADCESDNKKADNNEMLQQENRCQTSRLLAAYSVCLTNTQSCSYALSFGYRQLCSHPDHHSYANSDVLGRHAEKSTESSLLDDDNKKIPTTGK
jgi:hypothetical protein